MVQNATLGGGCFWCIEAVFKRVKGVLQATSGYMGGVGDRPTYEQVCSGNSGFIEVVRVEFEDTIVSFDQILELFLAVHDPTSWDKQGADVGAQYRSVIFYHSEDQQKSAKLAVSEIPNVVTEIRPVDKFYPAEEYHQNYYELNKDKNPYCRVVIEPKLRKLFGNT